MPLRKKTYLPLESLTNDSTNLQPTSPTIDSPPIQENSHDLLPSKGKVVPLITQKAPNKLKNKNKFGCLTWLAIFLGLGIGGVTLALPSLFGCGNSAKAAEARNNIGAMNRAQQAYFLEYQDFANSLERLGVGIRPKTVNYQYSIRVTPSAVFNYASPHQKNIKGYVGAVFLMPGDAATGEVLTTAIECEGTSHDRTQIADPTLEEGVPTCGSGTKELWKK